eukprot:CAMPEP_0184867236 /NCGR_PEP_ID=MMETSP0580-20130426/25590_1 /TAXON_ID=1118495 /ORGANISM="Dactyliosolen fragilissimus" /LENGTH=368 /DNA_ID=CAMNT_0027367383 /DNA_START=996 /DNA_END=2098 /DNA_ORIENTATION=+
MDMNMNSEKLRKTRDLAMKKSPKTCAKIKEILLLADNCFHALVPRIGIPHSTSSPTNCNDSYHKDEDVNADKEDEDFVDWEEGDHIHSTDVPVNTLVHQKTNADSNSNGQITHHNNGFDDERKDHLAAVEHSIAVMQQSGAIKAGALSIDFDGNDNILSTSMISTSSPNQEKSAVDQSKIEQHSMNTLKKCVEVLSNRYLPRLIKWIDGLRLADNMVSHNASTSSSTNSLTLIPNNQRKLRKEILHQVNNTRRDVERTLRSASRLNLPSILYPDVTNASLRQDDNNPSTTSSMLYNSNLSHDVNGKAVNCFKMKISWLETARALGIGHKSKCSAVLVQKNVNDVKNRMQSKIGQKKNCLDSRSRRKSR